jgi:HEAT repeat protein
MKINAPGKSSNGNESGGKTLSAALRNIITNYELRITNWRLRFRCLLFFGVLCLFAGSAFAQDNFELLAEKISRGSVEQKRDALKQIRNLETAQASQIAIPALRDSSEIVRATAAFSVIFLPADEAARVLLPLLGDKKEIVRREAAYALGKVRNPLAINSLFEAFRKDKILEVRNAAIVAVGEIGDASAVDALTRILQRKPKREDDADEFMRRSAARSIGQIAQIIRIGKTKVLTPENFPTENFKTNEMPQRTRLVEQFPVFRPAIAVLIQVLQNERESGDTKREAAFALGAIGDAAAIPVLQANTNSPDYYLAEISKESLRKITLPSGFVNTK